MLFKLLFDLLYITLLVLYSNMSNIELLLFILFVVCWELTYFYQMYIKETDN